MLDYGYAMRISLDVHVFLFGGFCKAVYIGTVSLHDGNDGQAKENGISKVQRGRYSIVHCRSVIVM